MMRRRRDYRLILSEGESEALRKLIPASDIEPPLSASSRIVLLVLAAAVVLVALAVLVWASLLDMLPESLSHIRDGVVWAWEALRDLVESARERLERL